VLKFNKQICKRTISSLILVLFVCFISLTITSFSYMGECNCNDCKCAPAECGCDPVEKPLPCCALICQPQKIFEQFNLTTFDFSDGTTLPDLGLFSITNGFLTDFKQLNPIETKIRMNN